MWGTPERILRSQNLVLLILVISVESITLNFRLWLVQIVGDMLGGKYHSTGNRRLKKKVTLHVFFINIYYIQAP